MKTTSEMFVIIRGIEIKLISFNREELISKCDEMTDEFNSFYRTKNKRWVNLEIYRVTTLEYALDLIIENAQDIYDN